MLIDTPAADFIKTAILGIATPYFVPDAELPQTSHRM